MRVINKFKNSRVGGFVFRHKIITIVIFVVVLGVVMIFRPKPPVPVPTATVLKTDLTQSISSTGSVDSATTVELSFITGGKLVYLGAKKGDQVSAFQTIATLDQRSLLKNLQSALVDYSKQRNTFDQTKQDDKNLPITDDLKRILEDNQYDLDKAVISVELQDLAKQQAVLTTPISGIVIGEDVGAAGVTVGPTTKFTIADPNNLVFKVDVDEADIGKVRVGQPMSIVLDAFPDKTFHFSVDHIDFASHTTSTGGTAYTVQSTFPVNPTLLYRMGMQGDAEIVTNKRSNVLTIPLASIVQDHYVYVKTPKGFVKKSITLGITSDINAEVVSGLHAGDKIALQPTDAAKQLAK